MSQIKMTSCDVCGEIAPKAGGWPSSDGWFSVKCTSGKAKWTEFLDWDICSTTCLEVIAGRLNGLPDDMKAPVEATATKRPATRRPRKAAATKS